MSSLWHKDIPVKVVLFARRLFRDRLSTKDNLHHRRVLDNDAQICVDGCGLIETYAHFYIVIFLAFFGTTFFGGLVFLRLCLTM